MAVIDVYSTQILQVKHERISEWVMTSTDTLNASGRAY